MGNVVVILGTAIAANCFWVYVVAPFLDNRPNRAFFVYPVKLPDKQKSETRNAESVVHNVAH